MRGGFREGAGRPKKIGDEARKNCTLKATEEEWQIILAFAKIVKHGNKSLAKKFVCDNQLLK